MAATPQDRSQPKRADNSAEPIALTVPAATAASGLSRSAIYREAARGNIVLRKLGRTTLVDMASVRAFLASLPVARIGGGRP